MNPWKHTAYLVVGIDTATGTLTGAGIFSEPNPSQEGTRIAFAVIQTAGGDSFHEAYEYLLKSLASDVWLEWLIPYLWREADEVAALRGQK